MSNPCTLHKAVVADCELSALDVSLSNPKRCHACPSDWSLVESWHMQVVRAMEASDKHVDKARVKSVLEDMMRRQGLVESRTKRQTRNEGLERLKFWLGIPNRYYSEEDTESESSDEGTQSL